MTAIDKRTAIMQKISDALMSAESMYIFPHMMADGDAMGSCASLCSAMRGLGKKADILMEDEIPDNLRFLDKNYVEFADEGTELPQRDICIALDCSNVDRFPKREKLFFNAGKTTICVDHHATETNFADINLIDSAAASNTEILYELYEFMGLDISVEMGEAIYTGIVTDTGNFQYTNTTKKTHLIAAELMELGIDTQTINITLFQSTRLQKLKLHSMIMDTLDIMCDGRFSMAYVTLDMYDAADAKTSESDGINSDIRDIKGVEVAVFLREKHDNEVKVGMRSKSYLDVSEICLAFGGGGHKHAAGCTVHAGMNETIEIIKKAVSDALMKYDRENSLS